jgi:thiol:disulfide interchange protein DsbC
VEKAVDQGIEVKYIFFPRQGLGSESFKKMVSVWCSKDRYKAFSAANKGEKIPDKECATNPVNTHYDFASKFGIQGTPSIILENGRMIPGYLPAEELIKLATANKS